jgi:cellobiose-specific phosphotransferase system component IIA
MKKQTVQERYNEQQIMKQMQPVLPKTTPTETQQQLQTIFTNAGGALMQAHQAVRQAQAGNPLNVQLQQASASLTHATQQLEQLKTAAPELATGLPASTQTQLQEADQYIQKAEQTLTLVMTQIGPSS